MTNELKTFHHELFQEVQLDADAAGQYSEDAFFDIFDTVEILPPPKAS